MKRQSEQAKDKLKVVEEGLKSLYDVDLFDAFYDEIWMKETPGLLEKYLDENEYYDVPLEDYDKEKEKVIEWFSENYGLAEINGEFWMFSVGNVDEGGYKPWYRIKIKTDDLETARKVILLDKCLPGKYCNIFMPGKQKPKKIIPDQ